MAEESYRGSCLCGGVSFEARGAPLKRLSCYCGQCQKNSGSTHQIVATFPIENMTVTDPNGCVKVFMVPGEFSTSGNPKEKVFCSRCGCTLWTIPVALKDKARIVRTSLIEGGLTNEKLKPTGEIFRAPDA